MRTLFCFNLVLFLSISSVAAQKEYNVLSPDNRLKISVSAKEKFFYSVSFKNQPLIQNSPIALILDNNKTLVGKPVVSATKINKIRQKVMPVVRVKRKEIDEQYNELILTIKGGFTLYLRAYNNGVAYRWGVDGAGSFKVNVEEATFNFVKNDTCYYQLEEKFHSHNERIAQKYPLSKITDSTLASLPALVLQSGLKVLVTESDLYDYAGMWLKGNGRNGLYGVFPTYPTQEEDEPKRLLDRFVTKRADYIAKSSGARTFPWRIVAVSEHDADILNNQIVYLLNREADKGADFKWVKPGKASWEWWNNWNAYNVNFKAGINTDTYKYYIDFAAKNGLEYLVLDEGWFQKGDITKVIPDLDMKTITDYAKQKKVGLILWVSWLLLDKQTKAALDLYQSWGIKGIKVDFMQRDDQIMVNYYERIAKECAKRQMLVDFHGAYKPTGMERQYPNIINREGVYGLENCKWDKDKKIAPEHDLTIPFIRMFAGMMDYTPGAMLNAQAADWEPNNKIPKSIGTRCHQLAMYVVYEAPLQMLADAPIHYEKEPECLEFLAKIPTVWEDTKAIDAKVSDYILMARQALNGDWYAGAMTDLTSRNMKLTLDFLGVGEYEAVIYQDGLNADRNAEDFIKSVKKVKKGDVLDVSMASGGGWVARISKDKTVSAN